MLNTYQFTLGKGAVAGLGLGRRQRGSFDFRSCSSLAGRQLSDGPSQYRQATRGGCGTIAFSFPCPPLDPCQDAASNITDALHGSHHGGDIVPEQRSIFPKTGKFCESRG